MEKIKILSISRFFITLIRCLLGKDVYGEDLRQRLVRVAEQEGYDSTLMYSLFFTKNKITNFEKRLFQITTWLFILTFFSFWQNCVFLQ